MEGQSDPPALSSLIIKAGRGWRIMREIWKDIPGYEGMYQISNFGRVKSLEREVNIKLLNIGWAKRKVPELIRKQTVYKNGYAGIQLHKQQRVRLHLIHRLVAQAFIPNPGGKPEVNHKNGDKLDNCIDNLEWVTASENEQHSRKVLGNVCGNAPRRVRCVETGIEYNSMADAGRANGTKAGAISSVANHIYGHKTAGGLHWELID